MANRVEYKAGLCIGVVLWHTSAYPHGYVMALYSVHKGHGLGSRVMEQICEEADARNLPLELFACPDRIEDLPRLIRFYERFGFKSKPGNTMSMERKPNETASRKTAS